MSCGGVYHYVRQNKQLQTDAKTHTNVILKINVTVFIPFSLIFGSNIICYD
jgi:hypothetical protein